MKHSIVVSALYKFVSLPDYEALKAPLVQRCNELEIRGTLLLASEGINGTIAGTARSVQAILAFIKADPRLADIEHKESLDNDYPFYRMKVKLKKEIVTLGVEGIDPNKVVGTYVKPEDWNSLIQDSNVLLLDTRNDYEYEVGTFDGAINPKTTTFREFPEYVAENCDPSKHKKVAMFCTGGIRCEKASAYMLEQGFDEVYHLKGGILKYIEEVPEHESLWKGDCFVFDNRVTVDHKLQKGEYDQCHGCRLPITEQDKQSEKYQLGVSCPRCFDHLSVDQKNRFSERQKQMQLAKQRDEIHLGSPPPARQRHES